MRGRFEMNTTTMRVLVVEPGKRPIVKRLRKKEKPETVGIQQFQDIRTFLVWWR